MEFRWEVVTWHGPGDRVELRAVRTDACVEVAMVPAGRTRYVVEVHRTREDGDVGDGEWRIAWTVGTTDDYSTALALVLDAVLAVESGSWTGR